MRTCWCRGKVFHIRPKASTEEKQTKFYDSTVRAIYGNPKYLGLVKLRDGQNVIEGDNAALKIV